MGSPQLQVDRLDRRVELLAEGDSIEAGPAGHVAPADQFAEADRGR
jgi:hypothetical protein